MIRVAIVDDDELVRGGLAAIVGAESDIEVVAQSGDDATASDLVEQTHPDVLVMDVRTPHLDGVSAMERVLTLDSPPQVVVISTYQNDPYVLDALRRGARGFVLKSAPTEQLLTAIRTAATSDALLFPDSVRELAQNATPPEGEPAVTPAWLPELTDAEEAVLDLVLQGYSNLEIADRLNGSVEDVERHLGSLLTKLNSRDRTALAVTALAAMSRQD